MPNILYGIETAEYKHPADILAQNAIEKAVPISKLGETLEEYEHKYQDEIVFKGSYVKLTEHNAPRIIHILNEAMEIMDCYADITVFSYRHYSYRMSVGGIKKPFIIIPDIIIRKFDNIQLLFLFGQMLTMINGRMLKLYAISKNIDKYTALFPAVGMALNVPIGQWRRKAQLTIDRGGLLCCQDFECAMKYLTILSGAGTEMVNNMDISARVDQIINSQAEDKSTAVAIGKLSQTVINGREAWANERFIELYNWHESGEYGKLISKHT